MPSALIKEFEGFQPDGFPFGSGSQFNPVSFVDPGDVSNTLFPEGSKILNGMIVLPNEDRGHAWEKTFEWPVNPLIFPEYLTGFVYGFGFDAFETDEDTKFCSLAKYATMQADGTVTYDRVGGVCDGVTYRLVANDGFVHEWTWEFDTETMTHGPVLTESGAIAISQWTLSGGMSCVITGPSESEVTSKYHVGPIEYTETTETSTPPEDGASGSMEYTLTSEIDLTVVRGLVSEWTTMPMEFRLATNSTAPPQATETTAGQYCSAAGGYARYRTEDVDMPDGYELVLDCVIRRNAPPYRDFNRGLSFTSYDDLNTDYVDVRSGREFSVLSHNILDESPMKIGLVGGMSAIEGVSVIGAAVRLASKFHDRRYRVKGIWTITREDEGSTETEITLETDEIKNSRRVSDWSYWDQDEPGGWVSGISFSIKDGAEFELERYDDESETWKAVETDEVGYQERFGYFYTGIRSPESEIWIEVRTLKGERKGYTYDDITGWRKKYLDASLMLDGASPDEGQCGVTLSGNCSYSVEITKNKWGKTASIAGDNLLEGTVNSIDYSVDDRNPEMKHHWYPEPELLPDQDHTDNEFEASPVPVVARDNYPPIPFQGEEVSRSELYFPIRSDLEFGVRYTEWRPVPDPPSGCYVQLEYPRIRK